MSKLCGRKRHCCLVSAFFFRLHWQGFSQGVNLLPFAFLHINNTAWQKDSGHLDGDTGLTGLTLLNCAYSSFIPRNKIFRPLDEYVTLACSCLLLSWAPGIKLSGKTVQWKCGCWIFPVGIKTTTPPTGVTPIWTPSTGGVCLCQRTS